MKQALVFADRNGEELAPLNETYCPAMLPIAGRPVLEYTLAALQAEGIEQVFIVVPSGDATIRTYFESGARWSLELQYLTAREMDTPDRIRASLGRSLQIPFVAMRGDVWRQSVRRLSDVAAPYSSLSETGHNQYELWDSDANSLQSLAWKIQPSVLSGAGQQFSEFSSLVELTEFHRVTVYAAVRPASSPFAAETSDNLRVGAQTNVHPVCLSDGATTVGDFSCVELGAELSGTNVIGSNCFVARGAYIKNSVILDNTFVGAGMRVENAIVAQHKVIRIDLNAALEVTDSFFLAPNQTGWLKRLTFTTLERVVILLLLVVSSVAPILAGTNRRSPLQKTGIQAALLKAFTGRSRLFGRIDESPAITQDSGVRYPWEAQYTNIRSGVLSPAELAYPEASDAVLLSLAEIEHDKPECIRALLKNACRAILSLTGSGKKSTHPIALQPLEKGMQS